METIVALIIASVVLFLIVLPLLYFFRRSTDVRLAGDLLILRFPFKKEVIVLTKELKSWHLQEAHFLRLGIIYSVNLELKNGNWRSVSSRFNPESFKVLFTYLETHFPGKRKADNK